jgi:uncharacterized protein YaaW (UPF0174 family)
MTEEGIWLSITEYSRYRKISISTIRRYIKSESVRYKSEDGKYFIYVPGEKYKASLLDSADKLDKTSLLLKLKELEQELRILKEENDDLKMLVTIYETNGKNKANVQVGIRQ